jgi:hypothetical protein
MGTEGSPASPSIAQVSTAQRNVENKEPDAEGGHLG